MSIKTLSYNSYLVFLFIFFVSPIIQAKVVHYELNATQEKVNLSGKKEVDFALLINGSIPAPTLEFTEGDIAEIVLKNSLKNEEVSLHWHGILLDPKMDGVPYLNTPPIKPGTSFTFKFPIRQNGTYWYHSHTGLQEQKGVFGAIVIHPKTQNKITEQESVVIISDWSDENPDQILKNLKKDGDYYQHKKNTIRSLWGAFKSKSIKNYFTNEWQRMGGMDLSDVGYDAFLINGKNNLQLVNAKRGEKQRIRIINASSSSYVYVSLGDQNMKVISADGKDIVPVFTKEILMGMAETYDVEFTLPAQKNYELRATAQDLTGFASAWIGSGEKENVPAKAPLNLYETMDHSHHHMMNHHMHHMDSDNKNSSQSEDHSAHQQHQHHEMSVEADNEKVIPLLKVDDLKSLQKSAFDKKIKSRDINLVLGGDMRRYVWHINGKTINDDMYLPVSKGEILRITFENQTMMHHPMHLHGHFFRVLNKHQEFSPIKHTVDVSPHSSRTIEVLADEPGQWMFHCHNLYHMHTGMGRVLNYIEFKPESEIQAHQQHDPHQHEHAYYYGRVGAATNNVEAYLRYSTSWNQIEFRGETINSSKSFHFNKNWENEADLFYRRWFSEFLNLVGGASYWGEKYYANVGFSYTLPLLIEAQLLINQKAQLRLDLEKKIQWTSKVLSELELSWHMDKDVNFSDEIEWKANLMFAPNWTWAFGANITDKHFGVGAKAQF